MMMVRDLGTKLDPSRVWVAVRKLLDSAGSPIEFLIDKINNGRWRRRRRRRRSSKVSTLKKERSQSSFEERGLSARSGNQTHSQNQQQNHTAAAADPKAAQKAIFHKHI